MTEAEKIGVILHEYDSLRQEVVGRANIVLQLFALLVLTVIGALTIWSGQQNEHKDVVIAIVAGLGVITFVIALWATIRDVKKNAMRLREIEREINERSGEKLLQWETYWGGGVNGLIFSKKYPPKRPKDERKYLL